MISVNDWSQASVSGGGGVKIGVLTQPAVDDTLAEAIAAAGGDPVSVTPDTLSAVDAVVTVGEAQLLALATESRSVPILPIDAAPGVQTVDRTDATAALERLVTGEFETQPVPLLEATVGERTVCALRDVMLVTTEPARISEYAIDSHGERVAAFRADGVVVATPAGSHGYARAAGGSVLAPGEQVSVVPVSPFAIDMDQWVLPMAGLSLSVVRDEAEVELLADTRREMVVPPGTTVSIAPNGTLPVAVVTESRPALTASSAR